MKEFFTFYGFLRIFTDFGFMHEGILYILRIFTDFYGFWIYEGVLYILQIFTDFYGFMRGFFTFYRFFTDFGPRSDTQTLRHSKKTEIEQNDNKTTTNAITTKSAGA